MSHEYSLCVKKETAYDLLLLTRLTYSKCKGQKVHVLYTFFAIRLMKSLVLVRVNSFILPNLHVENYFQFKCYLALILDIIFSYKKI